MRGASLSMHVAWLVAAWAVSGCYDAHGRSAAWAFDAAGLASPPDTGAPDRTDAGARWRRRDAGAALDAAAPPLPPEPEPDPLPDEPPTGPWDDVPPPPAHRSGLEPVGDRVALDDATDAGGPPSLVWNGEGWGVTWGGWYRGILLRFGVLDADGVPVSAFARAPGVGGMTGLDFAIGRYGLVSPGGRAATFDRAATLVSGWSTIERADSADVARLSVAHRWLVGSGTDDGAGTTAVRVFTLDDEMSVSGGSSLAIASDGLGDVRVGTAKTRALVVWPTRTGVMGRILRGAPLEPIGDPLTLLVAPQTEDSLVEVELFRDRFLLAAVGVREIYARVVDAFSDAPLASAPITLGRASVRDRRPGIAVAPEHGFFVVCWASGPGPWGGASMSEDGVSLQVVGADGALWGTPLALVTGERNVGGVTCGWNGQDIVVIWWRASGDGDFNEMFSERARPTFL